MHARVYQVKHILLCILLHAAQRTVDMNRKQDHTWYCPALNYGS